MKYFFLVLFLLPLATRAQQKPCKTAYIHASQMLDSLPAPADIQVRLDSMKAATDADIAKKKAAYEKVYKSPRTVDAKLQKDQKVADENYIKFRRKLLQKVYQKKITQATMLIYDKGKGYDSVFNADSPVFSKIPDNTCDVTPQCLKLVKGME